MPKPTSVLTWHSPQGHTIPRDGTHVLAATAHEVCEAYFEDGRWFRANLTLRDEDALIEPLMCARLPPVPAVPKRL